ncbi:MAG: hypothetical protein K9L89_07815, partial [Kiritimatiellales bacterium]|nr:hypothetical protein [Kiritimatiellales bacterium]
MITFGLVRKIGRMLRGGAGKKEIFLGAFCGVLIGFNPVASLTLALAILITLLLNANIGFTLLGVALGKLLSLAIAPITFHTGYFIIHSMGLEGLFTTLANAPVTALMGLDVYAMIGSLPYAIVAGFVFAKFMGATITKIREQMVKADEHEKVGKVTGHRFSRFLMWLVFGKQKISTADVLAKQSPLLRKSGIILVASVVLIGLVLEFFLLDLCVKKSLQAAISAETGAEVDIDKAHLSLAGGKLELENLQVADPDKLTHNLVQIDTLAADLSVGDLLRSSYAIDLLAGSTLKRDVPRETPGKLVVKEKKAKEEKKPDEEKAPGQALEDYFAKAKDWKKYGDKAHEYLKKHRENAETIAKGEKPKPSKEAAVIDAKKVGYLKATADLVADRPAWLIHEIKIDNVLLGGGYPAQTIQASEVSSHPELNGKPTAFVMTPVGGTEPTAKLVLRFDDPAAMNELAANLAGVAIGGAIETSDSFPLNIKDGKADIKADGTFSADMLKLPFTILVHDLKADVEEGKTVMGMDGKTATEVFSSMNTLEIDGSLGGS